MSIHSHQLCVRVDKEGRGAGKQPAYGLNPFITQSTKQNIAEWIKIAQPSVSHVGVCSYFFSTAPPGEPALGPSQAGPPGAVGTEAGGLEAHGAGLPSGSESRDQLSFSSPRRTQLSSQYSHPPRAVKSLIPWLHHKNAHTCKMFCFCLRNDQILPPPVHQRGAQTLWRHSRRPGFFTVRQTSSSSR